MPAKQHNEIHDAQKAAAELLGDGWMNHYLTDYLSSHNGQHLQPQFTISIFP